MSVSLSFSLLWLAAAVHFWAKVAFRRKQRSLSVRQTFLQCFSKRTGVISINVVWWMFPFSQLIVGLKTWRKGYPRTILSCPRLVTKKSISWSTFPSWILSRHFLVISPAWLFVPSILWMLHGLSKFSVINRSLVTARGSRKFLVAPLSMRATSVLRVILKTNFIVRAFCLVMNIRRIDNAHTATTSVDDSKNLFR